MVDVEIRENSSFNQPLQMEWEKMKQFIRNSEITEVDVTQKKEITSPSWKP